MNISRTTTRLLLAALAVAAVTLLVHWPAVHGGFLRWDDDAYLNLARGHPPLSLATIRWAVTMTRPYYHPLTWLSHATDCAVWGPNPIGHHAVSLVWHALNSGLVVIFIWLLTGAAGRCTTAERWTLAVSLGLIFGIHPVQVESVAWIAERKTLLYAAFSLATMCAYLQGNTGAPSRRWTAATLICYAAALGAKPLAVSLPAVLLALDIYPLQRLAKVGWLGLLREKLVMIILAFGSVVVSFVAQAGEGTVMAWADHGAVERGLVAARAIVFYLWKLVWPAWLSPFYPLGDDIRLGQREFVMSLVLFGALTVAAVAPWHRTRVPAACWLAYLALVVPASGLVQVGGQAAADHYLYLPMLAPLVALGCGVVWLARAGGRIGRVAGVTLVGCWLIYLGLRTRQQIPAWRNDVTLWQAVVAYYPTSSVPNWRLAMALTQAGRFEEARLPAERAAGLDPEFSLARSALGLIYLKTGRPENAINELRAALQLEPSLPGAQYNLACAYSRVGKFAEAYETLHRLREQNAPYVQRGRTDRELENLRRQPEYADRLKAIWGE